MEIEKKFMDFNLSRSRLGLRRHLLFARFTARLLAQLTWTFAIARRQTVILALSLFRADEPRLPTVLTGSLSVPLASRGLVVP